MFALPADVERAATSSAISNEVPSPAAPSETEADGMVISPPGLSRGKDRFPQAEAFGFSPGQVAPLATPQAVADSEACRPVPLTGPHAAEGNLPCTAFS
jgi:hypothetical protein